VPGASAFAKRVTLPGKGAIRYLGHANHRVNSWSNSECRILRHVDLSADDVALHQCEHERAAGLHEAAGIDVPLGDDAIERRDDAQVVPLLVEDPDQGLLSRDVRLGDGDRSMLGFESEAISVALLRRQPPLLDQGAVAIVGDLCEIPC